MFDETVLLSHRPEHKYYKHYGDDTGFSVFAYNYEVVSLTALPKLHPREATLTSGIDKRRIKNIVSDLGMRPRRHLAQMTSESESRLHFTNCLICKSQSSSREVQAGGPM